MTRAVAAHLTAAALACAALTACDTLHDAPAPSQTARCALPCPPSCPASCLPSGFCQEVTLTAGALGLGPIPEGGSWTIAAAGFPAGARLGYRLNLGFDIEGRDGRVPYPLWVVLETDALGNFELACVFRETAPKFPVWQTYSSAVIAGADGVARVGLLLRDCQDQAASVCSLDPASILTFSLLDPTRWREAPACP